MARRRTTVFADELDLAILKAAAARQGISEAELVREAIHLAAMAHRTWDEPFFSQTYVPEAKGQAPATSSDVLDEAWSAHAEQYQQTRHAAS
jgi:hypothetical protein